MNVRVGAAVRAHPLTLPHHSLAPEGRNFGPCPTVTIALYTGPSARCVCCASPTASVSADHTRVWLAAPVGEGDGLAYAGFEAGGFYVRADSAGQASSPLVPFGWLPPVVSAVLPNAAAGYPTAGNVTITLRGTNLGAPLAVPEYAPDAFLRVRVYVAPVGTPFVDPITPNALPGTPPAASRWTACADAARPFGDHTTITCTLPEGAGRDLAVVAVAGGQQWTSPTPLLSYDQPRLDSMSITRAVANGTRRMQSTVTATPTGAVTTLMGPTLGGYTVTLRGANFGPSWLANVNGALAAAGSPASCIFLAWRGRPVKTLACDDFESFLGEGEVNGTLVTSWSHSAITFTMPPGAGAPLLLVSAAGQTQINVAAGDVDTGSAPAGRSPAVTDPSGGTGKPTFEYEAPVITSISPSSGPTLGGTRVNITG